jgi:hypothetical protein
MKQAYSAIAKLEFDESESILYIEIMEGAEMNVNNTKEHYDTIKTLTNNKPYLALIDASIYYIADAQSLKYAASSDVINNRVASAYYNSSFANTLTINFYKSYYKPSLAIQLFKTKEAALEWLKTQALKF